MEVTGNKRHRAGWPYFRYKVPRNASHYEIVTPVEELQSSGTVHSMGWLRGRTWARSPSRPASVRKNPAYQGSLWIDADTGTITRVTLVADLRGNRSAAPSSFYGPVQIADKTLICPVRSLALSCRSVHGQHEDI